MAKALQLLLLALVLTTGCRPLTAGVDERRPDAGELLLYLQALPPEAARLRFTLAEAAAVRDDGTAFPLALQLAEPTGPGSGRQRLLAAGSIPEGSYRGMALTVGRAWLLTEEEAALLTPTEPLFVAAPFVLRRQEAALLEVAYRHEGSIRQQFHFLPAFFAHVPERPAETRLGFASDRAAGRLTVFDRKTLRATGVVAVGDGAAGLALDERGRRLYVALAAEDAVAVLDVASGALIGRIPLQAGDRPERLALTPDGRLLLAVNTGSDSVSLLDPLSLVELSRLGVGEEPRSVLLDRSGRRAFVFNRRANSISVLDLGRRQVILTLATDPGPYRGAFNRDGSRLYVIHRDSPYLTVLDAAALTVRERLLVGLGAGAVLVDPRTDLLYLGREDLPRIDIYDPFSLLAVDFLAAPGGVADLLIDDEENRLLVAAPAALSVAAVDLIGKGEAGRVEVGPGLHSLGLMGARR